MCGKLIAQLLPKLLFSFDFWVKQSFPTLFGEQPRSNLPQTRDLLSEQRRKDIAFP